MFFVDKSTSWCGSPSRKNLEVALSFSTKELWVFQVPSKVSFFDCKEGNEENSLN